jgi:hypothetical protein
MMAMCGLGVLVAVLPRQEVCLFGGTGKKCSLLVASTSS